MTLFLPKNIADIFNVEQYLCKLFTIMFSLKPNLFIYNKNFINVSIVYAVIKLIDLL